jgi:tetratricopeptide (TPR) repeat protein
MEEMFVSKVPFRPSAVFILLFACTVSFSQQKPEDKLFQEGVLRLKDSKFPEAEAAFRKVAELEPAGLRGSLGVAQVFFAQKQPDQAVRFLQAALAANPGRLDLLVALGDSAVRAGQPDLALAEYRLALTGASSAASEDLYVPRGAAGGTIVGRPADPVAESLNVLAGRDATPKGLAGIHLRLAETYRLRNDHIGAAEEWAKLSALMPKTGWILTNLGMEMEAAGKREDALKVYREVLAVDPSNAVVLNNLAFMIAETPGGDLFEALRLARRAKMLVPGSADIMDTEGWVSLKQGYVDDAIGTFLRVVSMQPVNPAFRKHLADAITQRGLHSPAVDALVKVLNSPPIAGDEEEVRNLLRNLATEQTIR